MAEVLAKSPDELLLEGRFAKFVLGSQEDEGTLFSHSQSNIIMTAQLAIYTSSRISSPAQTTRTSQN
ncbi:hypothetical protein PAAG_12505 [Paracoccidioides lutzii Pb01]|uniref:Uncharacterized protein n=1 Tax=Paracoccidioides lutzii (strain ATCC MYA-826 / Pb01) TaxID=502779 RepID=A0A0A2V3W0_PARBA|nr:hypothetical protein PAAG_12505 [Paracoccidioides lutzii Pb01]KGQ00840.1 hypothetical protein PAAG_12505 [Paracoccidioides lutzii Pb01]